MFHSTLIFRLPSKLLLTLCATILLLGSCSSDDDGTPTIDPTNDSIQRTVLIYMAAQNSLGSNKFQVKDSIEIMKGKSYISSDDRLLYFIDDDKNPRIYRITSTSASPILVKSWDEDENSTSPDFFREVLTWMKENYEAKEYGLVLWSHGNGWLPAINTNYTASAAQKKTSTISPASFGIDDGEDFGDDSGTEMDIDDMATAIAESGIHPKYIFFDACLMQCLEVDYALKDVTDYIVASPISTCAAGANYTHQIQSGFFEDDPSAIAETYTADVADRTQVDDYSDWGGVFSTVQTDKLQAVADALADALPYSSLMDKASPDMSGVTNYMAYAATFLYRPHFYDAAEALRKVIPADCLTAVLEALDEAVVYKGATTRFWIGPGYWTYQNVNANTYSGISMFIPQNIYTQNASRSDYGDHNESFKSTSWYTAAGWAQTGW